MTRSGLVVEQPVAPLHFVPLLLRPRPHGAPKRSAKAARPNPSLVVAVVAAVRTWWIMEGGKRGGIRIRGAHPFKCGSDAAP